MRGLVKGCVALFASPQDLYGNPEVYETFQRALANPKPAAGSSDDSSMDKSDVIGARSVELVGEKPAYMFGFDGSSDGTRHIERKGLAAETLICTL